MKNKDQLKTQQDLPATKKELAAAIEKLQGDAPEGATKTIRQVEQMIYRLEDKLDEFKDSLRMERDYVNEKIQKFDSKLSTDSRTTPKEKFLEALIPWISVFGNRLWEIWQAERKHNIQSQELLLELIRDKMGVKK